MDALDILHYGDLEVRRGFEGLAPATWAAVGVTSRWSPRDLLAHLASYELLLADVLASVAGERPTPTLDAMQADHARFNDAQVAARAAQSPEALLSEYAEAHERAVALAKRLGPERLRERGTIPWYGEHYALDDFIVYASYGHKREHVAQLKQFRARR